MEAVVVGVTTAILIENTRLVLAGKSRVKDNIGLVFVYKIRPVAHQSSPHLNAKLDEAFKQADGENRWWSDKNTLCLHYITDGKAVNIGIHGAFCDLLEGIFPGKMKLHCSRVNLQNSHTHINKNELIWKTDQRSISVCACDIPSTKGFFTDNQKEVDEKLTKDELERCLVAGKRSEVGIFDISIGEVGITWTL